MTNGNRATLGAALGVLFGYTAFLAVIALGPKQPGYLSTGWAFVVLLFMFPVVILAVGPGAFLLSWIHAVRMQRHARLARTKAGIRMIGILLGMPLGVANLILVTVLLVLANGGRLQSLRGEELMFYLLLGSISGSGMGWGATIGLEPGAARRPPATRCDGPPFFDHRPRRAG